LRFEPGTAFSYNSMNSYMLAAIHRRITGITLTEFLEARLWRPLDIRTPFWETCPKGIEKGGWGLYLSTEAMARLGQLFLDKGTYNGRRIIGEDLLAEAVSTPAAVSERVGAFDYGYQLWVERTGESFLFNGILGQNVWVYPKRKLVFAVTAEEPAVFQDATALLAAMEILKKDESWEKRRHMPSERRQRYLFVSSLTRTDTFLRLYIPRVRVSIFCHARNFLPFTYREEQQSFCLSSLRENKVI
jgi:CubicO group peptidase (beta-lactamase class C family)